MPKQVLNKAAFEYYLYLKQVGFAPDKAKMLLSQAAFETGNFTSRIFKENNNLFGMKLPKIRKTTAIGEKYSHAVYTSIEDSIKDIYIYHTYFKHPAGFINLKKFVESLKSKGYFEADLEKYYEGVKHYYRLYFNEYE